MNDHYIIYGLSLSYFSRKMEAAFIWYGAPFRFVHKTLAVKELVESRSGTHQVPVVHTPENWMIGDTTPLISLMDARYPARRLVPEGPLGVLVHVLEEWFDEWIGRLPVLFRWLYEECASSAAPVMARETAPEADAETQANLAAMIAGWGQRACRATGVSEPGPKKAGEEELERIYAQLDRQLGETRYALGDRPTAVDAVLLGGLRAHFYFDPVPRRLVEKFPRIVKWITSADAWDGSGDLAPFPESTPFARFVLSEMTGAYKHFILGNAAALAAGQKAFTAETHGHQVSYLARPYPERSRRMVKDRIANRLIAAERETVNAWLKKAGLWECFGAE